MKKITGKNNDWYHRWFGSQYYHILYKHRDNTEAKKFLDNLNNYLNLKPGDRILDLACGRGRHSIYLAEKGFDITGIDLSSENILYATSHPGPPSKRRGGEKNLPAFFVHDMRKVFKKKYYDVVLNLFTSFGYFEDEKDDLDVLSSVNSGLKKEGVFVLDFMNVKKAIPRLRKQGIQVIENTKFEINRSVKNRFIIKTIKVEKLTPACRMKFLSAGKLSPSPKGRGRKKISEPKHEVLFFEERVRALTLEDFKKYFSETGFKIIEIFGNYDLSNFDEKNSERLIIVGKKKKKGGRENTRWVFEPDNAPPVGF